jgi:hypothetical protein
MSSPPSAAIPCALSYVVRILVVSSARTDRRPALAQRGFDGTTEVLLSREAPASAHGALVAACLAAFFRPRNDVRS